MKYQKIRQKFRSHISSLMQDQRGSMLALAAVSMTVIVGFAAMGVDVATWYSEKRQTQSMADASAVAATYAMQEGASTAEVNLAARTEAIRNGFTETPGNTLIVANAAPLSTPGSAIPRADVTVTRRVPVFFASPFLESNPSVQAAATGGVRTLGNICVIGLDEDEGRTVEFIGNTFANVGCGVASNSSSGDALYVGGNATLIANPAQAFGDIIVDGSGELFTQLPPMPFSPRVPDPFENRIFPPMTGSCDFIGGLTVDSDQTIGPNLSGGTVRICGDFTVRPNRSLTMEPGIYFVDSGNVLFQGNVTGTGVTIVLTGASASEVGEIDIRAQSIVSLTAPSLGEYRGIVVHQDAIADESGDNKFNGGANLTFVGAIYIKNQPVTYNGGSDVDGCTMIVARIVKFSGTSFLRNTETLCNSVGLDGNSSAQEQVILLN